MSGEESVEYGLIDTVLESRTEIAAKKKGDSE